MGGNYLADVTNSDSGSIGQDGGLFLVNEDDSTSIDYDDAGYPIYTFTVNGTDIVYEYSASAESLYGEDGILTLTAGAEEETIYNLSFTGLRGDDETYPFTWLYRYDSTTVGVESDDLPEGYEIDWSITILYNTGDEENPYAIAETLEAGTTDSNGNVLFEGDASGVTLYGEAIFAYFDENPLEDGQWINVSLNVSVDGEGVSTSSGLFQLVMEEYSVYFENTENAAYGWDYVNEDPILYSDQDLEIHLNTDSLDGVDNYEIVWATGVWSGTYGTPEEQLIPQLTEEEGYFSVSEDGSTVTLHGEKIAEYYYENGEPWLDVLAIVYIDGVELCRFDRGYSVATSENYLTNNSSDYYQLPGWDFTISTSEDCHFSNAANPYGCDTSATVTDVSVDNTEIAYAEWNEDENIWHIYSTNNGDATVTITYNLGEYDEDGNLVSYEQCNKLYVQSDIYYLDYGLSDNTSEMLVGTEKIITFNISHDYVDGNGDNQWEQVTDTFSLSFEYELLFTGWRRRTEILNFRE
ncbi:MAG: hypothetical protein LIP11_16700, partial [Clostridiales bacterium]|nr:hypothetical protein [Clostridiales bacterium]